MQPKTQEVFSFQSLNPLKPFMDWYDEKVLGFTTWLDNLINFFHVGFFELLLSMLWTTAILGVLWSIVTEGRSDKARAMTILSLLLYMGIRFSLA